LPHNRPSDAGTARSSKFTKRPRTRCTATTQTPAKLGSMVRPGQASGAKMRIILGFLTVKGSLCPNFPPTLVTALQSRAI
jgi:hypothetical protein